MQAPLPFAHVINEDHYIKHVSYAPCVYTFTKDHFVSRYIYIGIRTFMNSNDPSDMDARRKVHDAIKTSHPYKSKLDLLD